jgi:hypothetical protein
MLINSSVSRCLCLLAQAATWNVSLPQIILTNQGALSAVVAHWHQKTQRSALSLNPQGATSSSASVIYHLTSPFFLLYTAAFLLYTAAQKTH